MGSQLECQLPEGKGAEQRGEDRRRQRSHQPGLNAGSGPGRVTLAGTPSEVVFSVSGRGRGGGASSFTESKD